MIKAYVYRRQAAIGIMVDEQWQLDEQATSANDSFKHLTSQVRNWITPDGSRGPSGEGGFTPLANRYPLYVSLACPFAHRTLIVRHLKRLERFVPVSIVNPYKFEQGWSFKTNEHSERDPINDFEFLHEVYAASNANYSGRVSVPVLWDKQQGRIVSNDSGDIMRMFNSAFESKGAADGNYCHDNPANEIDRLNEEFTRTLTSACTKRASPRHKRFMTKP